MILLIDNYDSFVHNLARYFVRLGQKTRVVRNDAITIDEIQDLNVDAIVLSPGPCGPNDAGICLDVVRRFWQVLPILGVCLGHQVIAEFLGANVIRSGRPIHGRKSSIEHDGTGVFRNVPCPMEVGRYHALVVDENSNLEAFDVTARTSDGTIMAISHHEKPVFGLQFHPESILTEYGHRLLANFLELANMAKVTSLHDFDDELRTKIDPSAEWPSRPVTF